MIEKNKRHLYRIIFTSTLAISSVTVGGGYVIVPLLKKRFVDELGLLEQGEVLDLIVIAQSSPGAIAINASLQIGYRIAGITGAFLAVIGTIIPPLVLISIVAYFYAIINNNLFVHVFLMGLKAGVAAVILNIAYDMGVRALGSRKKSNLMIMFVSVIAALVFQINVVYIIVLSALFGVLRTKLTRKNPEVIS